ncbi:hypothetical protein CAPTEDRAFT_162708 [Capitella teleta]|uniref:Enoyl reductase (ER) domain-containing protein n=1 Tax=Capitella teleta TaxID=283909 RepID=R7TIU6_CAPTE|nr:hypothetical protein CAPTEDRAFT_162708 [Capitella teleta]|eukprot:ELT93748.1 hypothetical protein CAPTEDRAFT_162708 [Capitella teleta]
MAENAEQEPKVENSTPAKEMRAIRLAGFGGIKMLKVQNVSETTPADGEVLIRVKAVGVNFADLMVRQGAIDNPPKTPFTMGSECSGEVEALGENVEGFQVGDRVIAVTDFHSWAELVAVPTARVFKMPTGMNYHDGAAFFMSYVTAYIMLFDIGNFREGQSVLIHSAGGGVGQALCQLSKNVTDATLFGTASANKHEAIKAKLTHLYDHSADYVQEIKKESPEGVDIVLDCLCGEDTNRGISILKPLGKYILYGSSNVVTGETKSFFSFAKSWWQVDKISPIKLYDENKCISGFNLRQLLFKQNQSSCIKRVVEKLFSLYNEGKIKPVIDSTWAFEDVGEAMQIMHDRKNVGKIVLDPAMEPKPKEEAAPAAATTDAASAGSGEEAEKAN